ncbi:hypothetical protein [Myxococcus xanthus]|uniref:Uncharacterized protein n=1 Tax=Myxococcus xanthus TaxID=34 RepID=A0A7Y4IGH2_MYXXA|nr:hypothetical protein [Myxococcus xanthus]NOJ78827.1 hypothetical protein [Myxococcus xanthus]NOJ85736.1 hypothetical protein [Myxococcus xanthus]
MNTTTHFGPVGFSAGNGDEMKRGWGWAGALFVAGWVWTGCGSGSDTTGTEGLDVPPSEFPQAPEGDAGTPDSGTQDSGTPAEPDAGEPDSGTPDDDGGTPDSGTPDDDGGTPDGGPEEVPLPTPSAANWEFFGREAGGPRFIHGVSADASGNIWVAGGEEGLFLMKKGERTFRRYTMAEGLRPYGYMPDGSAPPGPKYLKVISVAGAWNDTVFVGYEGMPGDGALHCENNWDSNVPDPARYKSGDADRVSLRADGTLDVVHYDIFSGPNVVDAELRGREKLCNIWRIAYDAKTNSVWFGANHGLARGDADYRGDPTCNGQFHCWGVEEHSHPGINAYIYTNPTADRAQYGEDRSRWRVQPALLTDAYWGLGVRPDGDVWVGGANRTTRYFYGTVANDFWEGQTRTESRAYAWNRIDIWKDAVGEEHYSRPEQRTDDLVSGIAVTGTSAWVGSFGHGLAELNDSGQVVRTLKSELAAPHVASVAADPANGSIWAGHSWGGGLSRVRGGSVSHYGLSVLGRELSSMRVPDIQVDRSGPRRRMLVAFQGATLSDGTVMPGTIGIYSGD